MEKVLGAGLGQKLLCLLGVALKDLGVGIEAGDAGVEEAGGGHARAGEHGVDNGLAVDGEREGLAHADVLEGRRVEVEVHEPGAQRRVVGDELADLGVVLVLLEQVVGQVTHVDVAVLEAHELGVGVVDEGDREAVEGHGVAVVVLEALVAHEGGVVVLHELEGAGAHVVELVAPLVAGLLAGPAGNTLA